LEWVFAGTGSNEPGQNPSRELSCDRKGMFEQIVGLIERGKDGQRNWSVQGKERDMNFIA